MTSLEWLLIALTALVAVLCWQLETERANSRTLRAALSRRCPHRPGREEFDRICEERTR
jgi:hypothetical protein